MDIKKVGYITAGLTVIISIVIALIITGKIDVDTSKMLLGDITFIYFAIPAVLLFFSFVLLANMEHQIVAIIDVAIALLYSVFLILLLIISKEDAQNLSSIFSFINTFIFGFIAANIPFSIRTQSKLHRYLKYGIVMLIVITTFLLIGVNNSINKAKNLKDLEAIQKNSEVATVMAYISFIGIICNPMIAYASSDGLGGGGSSSSPKLVPRNVATDPNMSTGINPNTGINYGDMPVPNGVVANNPTAVPVQDMNVPPGFSTPQVPTPQVAPIPVQNNVPVPPVTDQLLGATAAPVMNSNPALNSTPEVLNTNNSVPAPVTPAPSAQLPQNPTPTVSMTASEVAPELQFLLNNNNNNH